MEKPGNLRDLFEIENARNLTRDELVATFVPTKAFRRLLSAKHHIVLGSRGSGKTSLAKMLSHSHLSRLDDTEAKEAIKNRSLIGMYVPTSLEWVGGLTNKPWENPGEAEEFFQWRLNIASCASLLISVRSCLDAYIDDLGERAVTEARLIEDLSEVWSDNEYKCNTIRALQNYLERLENKKKTEITRARALGRSLADANSIGITFGTDLFWPLKFAIKRTADILEIPENCTWILCIDEAEFLAPYHHTILNSHLRADTGNLFFKITTMPYMHHGHETHLGVPADEGHDFEYLYIDQDPILMNNADSPAKQDQDVDIFASRVFNRRAITSGGKFKYLDLTNILGPSDLLDSKDSNWNRNPEYWALLEKYATSETLERARKLAGTPSFADQIGRKILPALLLRDAVEKQRGRAELEVYSGKTMVIRCADANPRRLIRIFNRLLQNTSLQPVGIKHGRPRTPRMQARRQNKVLSAFSTSTLTRVQSEKGVGPELYRFLQKIGSFMNENLHVGRITTDQISSFSVDENISDSDWMLIERCVALGLLFPNISINNPDQVPYKTGVFHLAYVLAPHFKLLPRRGRSNKLSSILRGHNMSSDESGQLNLGFR